MEYPDFLQHLIKDDEVEKSNYYFIDTIRLEEKIRCVTADIREKLGVDYLSCCLVLPNGERFILSNNPGGIVIPYYEHGFNRIDNIFNYNFEAQSQPAYFFPEKIPCHQFGKLFENILQGVYGVTNVIGFYRTFQGIKLTIILGRNDANLDFKVSEPLLQKIYDYILGFLESLLPLYVANKPALRYSHFYQNPNFRRRFVLGELQMNLPILKERELQCLYWARMGKTAEETAVILQLSKATVRRYLEDVREKYAVSTILEAIVLAIQQKIIS